MTSFTTIRAYLQLAIIYFICQTLGNALFKEGVALLGVTVDLLVNDLAEHDYLLVLTTFFATRDIPLSKTTTSIPLGS